MDRRSDRSPPGLSVLVLGMHRSGTSAVAGALERAGLWRGDNGAQLLTRPENPLGFAERTDVVSLDDRLLESQGWTWDTPGSVPPDNPLPHPDLVRAGRDLIEQGFGDRGRWFVKDPRISLLLPWWRQILLDRFVAVVTMRPAIEVAWSLSVLYGTRIELGLALWGAYYRHIARGLSGLPTVVVDFAALTVDPSSTTRALLDALHGLGVSGPFDVDEAIASIHPVLRRKTQPQSIAPDDAILEPFLELERAFTTAPVVAHKHFRLDVAPPSPWETAVLGLHGDLQRAQRVAGAESAVLRSDLDAAATDLDSLRIQMASAKRVLQSNKRLLDTVRGRTAGHAAPAPTSSFDAEWYLATYSDVRESGMDPLEHYLRHGTSEGREPRSGFDTEKYLEEHPIVREQGLNPLLHSMGYEVRSASEPKPETSDTNGIAVINVGPTAVESHQAALSGGLLSGGQDTTGNNGVEASIVSSSDRRAG
jgi:hypothetical protein